jgi:hypothetical protein
MYGATYEERAARAARTQSLFRDVNERVREINETFTVVLPHGDWVCECADDSCTERLAVSIEEYEAVRANSKRFIVAPRETHFFGEVEDLVARTERYWTVEKRDQAGELAARVDPRRVGLRGRQELPAGAGERAEHSRTASHARA